MKSILGRFILLLLVVLPTTIMVFESGNNPGLVVRADDPIEGEDDIDDEEATVETDDDAGEGDQAVTETEQAGEEEEEDDENLIKPSPDADTTILFTKPAVSSDLPAGYPVRFLVSFKNNGDEDFVVENMEASFRYPQDYTFFIQNYTASIYQQTVESKREATFEYGFTPSEAFSSRPFGLTVLLNYRDSDGNVYQNAVFNETINVVEPDEGLDGETFFLYVFLAALVVLLGVGCHQLITRFGKKHLSKPKAQKIEMGTQKTGVDYSWIPQETLNQELNKSPKRSPKQLSPRKRKTKRGSGEE